VISRGRRTATSILAANATRKPICESHAAEEHKNKSLLRFITCGSVDDGKSP
jgi:hypothetical protein